MASEEANWSGAALFNIKYVALYQQPGSSNLIADSYSGHGMVINLAWQELMC